MIVSVVETPIDPTVTFPFMTQMQDGSQVVGVTMGPDT